MSRAKYWTAMENAAFKKIGIAAGGWMAVLGVIVESMDDSSTCHLTASDIARELCVSRQAVHQSLAKLVELRAVEKTVNKHGKIKLKLSPHFGWNYGTERRDAELQRRRKEGLEKIMKRNNMKLVQGGKS